MTATLSNFYTVRLWVLALVTLLSCCVPFAFGQESPDSVVESARETDVTDFYQRQRMDEELRALRGDLDQVNKRLTELEEAQHLIQGLALKVSKIQGQIQIGDSSQTTLNDAFEALKGDINQLASKVNLLDSDIRRNLEFLVEGLPPSAVTIDQPSRATEDIKPLKTPIDSNAPSLSDEKKDAKIFYEYAKKLFDSGSYKEATGLFYSLKEAFPDNQYAKSGMYWVAVGLTKSDYQSQEALTVLTQLLPGLKSHNKHCAALLDAGMIHLERGECGAAENHLIEAGKICGDDRAANNRTLPQTRLKELKRRCAP